jgi:serine/threonine-protein kinase
LREAHAIGLIHRDIKPSNIIVGERGGVPDVAKLLDFGLVREVGLIGRDEKLTQEGMLAGTPAYMSPEQAAGKTEIDARSDLYSLGALAYFLLTGQPPFVRHHPVQVLAAHLCDTPVPPSRLQPAIPDSLETVVLHCLEKNPAQRYPDADACDRALVRCD